MAVILPADHFILTIKPKIQQLADSFLQAEGFNYFQFLRCYKDGSIGLLTNDTRITEYMHQVEDEPVVFSSIMESQQETHSYWFLWDEVLPTKPVQLAREKFNIKNGITCVKRGKDYYDMIAFALPNEPDNAGSFYLNKIKAMEHFIFDFERRNQDLILLMDKHSLALSEPYRDVNYQKLCLKNGRISIVTANGSSHITSQELACLRWLFAGLSCKETAQILQLSPRTVETYIKRIKQRTGYSQIDKLEKILTS